MTPRHLIVKGQQIALPTFFPVTTFGGKFPLDDLVRPYLPRFAPGIMVSYHYAKKMKKRPQGVVFVDSGGFASLFEGSKSVDHENFTVITTKEGDEITPPDVLTFQEKHADIGATVDFLIPPDTPQDEAKRRQAQTLKNALWAVSARTRPNFMLFASIQAWDAASAMHMTQALASHPFDGYALGGMVPRISKPNEIIEIIRAIRSVDPVRPLHIFGIGSPALMLKLIAAGADSFDSSSFVRAAVDGKQLHPSELVWQKISEDHGGRTNCVCPVCQKFDTEYQQLESESNRMALALHNLSTIASALQQPKQSSIQTTTN